MINFGDKKIKELRFGNKIVKTIHHGADLIYGEASPTPPPISPLDGGEYGKIWGSVAISETELDPTIYEITLTKEDWEGWYFNVLNNDLAQWGLILPSRHQIGDYSDSIWLFGGELTTGKYQPTTATRTTLYIRHFVLGSKCERTGDNYCSYYRNAYWYNNPLKDIPVVLPSSIKKIDDSFCHNTWFASELVIPEGVTEIGRKFMYGANMFNHDLVLPSTLEHCSQFWFMTIMNNMTSTIHVNCPVSVIANNGDAPAYLQFALCTTSATAPCFTQGIKLAGPYAQEWADYFPNTGPEGGDGRQVASGYYRNLIVV